MAEEVDAKLDASTESDQEVITLGEVLQNEQKLREDANAVLGAIDDKKCTYSEGYMKRQALYSCLTCIPESKTDLKKCAGVCLACCYLCHEGHELVELYTKRNFRCDCGNDKFGERVCNLDTSKVASNELNQYNHNFSGLYCTCSRPYPDPEETVSDEMIQCIICEDWYHTRHLGVPMVASYAEMTCEGCVKNHPFLLHYDKLSVNTTENKDIDAEVDVEEQDLPSTSTDETPSKACKKPTTKAAEATAMFWVHTAWRKQLCLCSDCSKVYEDENVTFLTDLQDTVQIYEEKGKAKAEEYAAKQEESDMKYLNSLNRVPLLEAIAGYNDLKTNLTEYLKKFAENKKVVREEDIREFFSELDAKKKQRTEVPFNCR